MPPPADTAPAETAPAEQIVHLYHPPLNYHASAPSVRADFADDWMQDYLLFFHDFLLPATSAVLPGFFSFVSCKRSNPH